MPGRETIATMTRDDGTVVTVTTEWDGYLTVTYEGGGEAVLSFAEEMRAWDALNEVREDDEWRADAARDFQLDGRVA